MSGVAIDRREWYVCLLDPHTLADQITPQPLLPAALDTFTLPTGTYFFEALVALTAMSTTSGNAALDWLGTGTAVTANWLWWANGQDAASGAAGASMTGSWHVASTSLANASIVGAATATAMVTRVSGSFRVTTPGTLIPAIDLITGIVTPAVASGTFIRILRLGPATAQSFGPVS